MINILLGIFYVALIALSAYLLYFIIKIAIKDAYYELDLKKENKKSTYENTELEDTNE